MKVKGLDGVEYVIDRDWLPWQRKTSLMEDSGSWVDLPDFPDLDFPDLGDDPISAIVGVIFLILFVILFVVWCIFVLPFLLSFMIVVGEILVLLALFPIFVPLRSLFFKWNIRVLVNKKVIHEEKIKGWFASRRLMRELQTSIQAGTWPLRKP